MDSDLQFCRITFRRKKKCVQNSMLKKEIGDQGKGVEALSHTFSRFLLRNDSLFPFTFF